MSWYSILLLAEEPSRSSMFVKSFLHRLGAMVIVAHIARKGVLVADVTYRPGFLVEVRVAKEFQEETIRFSLSHSGNVELAGKWEEALDNYFNEGRFDSKDNLFPGEIRRIGSARDHRTLFREAAHALLKDLELFGYTVELEFE